MRFAPSSFLLSLGLLLLRFASSSKNIYPINPGFYRLFLASEYNTSSAHLSQTKEALGQLNDDTRHGESLSQDLSWYDSLRRDIKSTLDTMDVDRHVVALQAAVEDLSEHTINLIVVFTVQTILFPLFFLWLAGHTIKAVIRLH